jgi:inosine-uridine nucleoside N-ribohydrolase
LSTQRVVIDCDPGIDDAVALMLAMASPNIDLCAVTTVAGNVSLSQTTVNALRILEMAGRTDISVGAGCGRPLVRLSPYAKEVHGEDGLGSIGLAPPSTAAGELHAVDLIAKVAEEDRFTLVAVGPLTNVAVLLARHPSVASQIDQLVIMGGAWGGGNTSPAAEFNIYVDPEAAARVFDSGVAITLVTLDLTNAAWMDSSSVRTLSDSPQRCAGTAGRMLETYLDYSLRFRGHDRLAVHDALAVWAVTEPQALTTVQAHVAVDYYSELSRGATVVDRQGLGGAATNVNLGVAVDREAFISSLVERIRTLP